MTEKFGTLVGAVLLSLLLAEPGAAQEGGGGHALSTLDGVYTEAQAKRGERVSTRVCSECHEDDEFVGAFIKSWSGATLAALYDDITSLMPEDRPGSLPPQQYVDVISYILELNGFPAGDVELGSERESLAQVLIQNP